MGWKGMLSYSLAGQDTVPALTNSKTSTIWSVNRIFDSRDFFCCNIFSKNLVVRYRGMNNKGVLERPWTKWSVLRAISTTLKCQFTGKC